MSQLTIANLKPSPSKILIGGLLLAVFAALAILFGSWAELDRGSLLFTAGCGAILGLLPTGSPASRIGAFLVGMLVAWIGFAIRAAVLPDNAVAEALAAFGAIAVLTIVAAVSQGRVPVIASLLGLVAMSGGYDAVFASAPYDFIASSIATVGAVLAGAAVGMLAVTIADVISDIGKHPEDPIQDDPALPTPPPSTLADPQSPSPIFDMKN